jgi:hypothetical protein
VIPSSFCQRLEMVIVTFSPDHQVSAGTRNILDTTPPSASTSRKAAALPVNIYHDIGPRPTLESPVDHQGDDPSFHLGKLMSVKERRDTY